MGAFDEESQRRLGLDGPLVAPVLASGLHTDAAEVRLRRRDFVQPRLEAEIGVQVRGSSVTLVPCVEVADCRVPGWKLASGWAVADFGLQGAMVFGAAREPVDVVRVDVLHDGQLVDAAERSWTDAVDRLRFLSGSARDGSCVVATGAMTPLVDAAPGRWDFRFHGLQTLTLHIT
jgi:2-keto-4-pentenoate hydratase